MELNKMILGREMIKGEGRREPKLSNRMLQHLAAVRRVTGKRVSDIETD